MGEEGTTEPVTASGIGSPGDGRRVLVSPLLEVSGVEVRVLTGHVVEHIVVVGIKEVAVDEPQLVRLPDADLVVVGGEQHVGGGVPVVDEPHSHVGEHGGIGGKEGVGGGSHRSTAVDRDRPSEDDRPLVRHLLNGDVEVLVTIRYNHDLAARGRVAVGVHPRGQILNSDTVGRRGAPCLGGVAVLVHQGSHPQLDQLGHERGQGDGGIKDQVKDAAVVDWGGELRPRHSRVIEDGDVLVGECGTDDVVDQVEPVVGVVHRVVHQRGA